ncbi:MAG TPA: hypothetical protein VFH51_12715 [Myxococcota bacterium]|nr:hypothetical protein [Myxococcota bacterium]
MHLTRSTLFAALLLLLGAGACAHSYIEGTQVVDTDENREILSIIRKARDALQARDSNTLLSMVSTKYFEDNGTPDPRDDYGYVELKEKLVKDSLETAKEVVVDFQIFDINVDGDNAYADIRYSSRTRLEMPSGRVWDTHRDFDRLQFVREDGTWRIVSGL